MSLNLTRKRGDTYPDIFTITSEQTGEAVDITGYTFLMTVDPEKDPDDATNNLFQLTGTITNASAGVMQFAPSAVQADQEIGTYYYDAQLIDDSGYIRTFESGKYKFVQDITK